MKSRVRVWFKLSLLDRLRVLFGAPLNHTLIVNLENGNVSDQLIWVGAPDPAAVRRLPIGSKRTTP